MYQITYYADREMRQVQPETDEISDAALARYPAPTGDETAFARHSTDQSLNCWGYDGAWHAREPREATTADAREREELAAARRWIDQSDKEAQRLRRSSQTIPRRRLST